MRENLFIASLTTFDLITRTTIDDTSDVPTAFALRLEMDDWTFDFVAGQDDVNNFHVRNEAGEDFRHVFVRSPNESSPLTMRISLVEVHHGKMVHHGENCEASLLVFELRFQSKLQERRYQSVIVTLEFFDKGGNNKRNPVVVELAPDRMHWLGKTTFDKTTKYGASLDIKASVPVVSGGPSVHWDVEETKHPKFKATLTGEQGASKGQNRENAVTWSMQENKNEAVGIPSFLQTSVLLKRSHSGSFYAKLRVTSQVDIRSATRRSLPITTDRDKIIDPVTFTPGKVQMKNTSVTGIKADDLLHMEKLPINEYFKVNNSDEDPLNPPFPEIVPATNSAVQKDPLIPAAVHTANVNAQKGAVIPEAPAPVHATNTDVQKEPLSPAAPVQTTDRNVHAYLLGSVASATAPTSKTMESVVLVPDRQSTAAELALKAVLKAAEATKVASKAAQAAADAAEEALEAVSKAAKAVARAAEEKQVLSSE